MGKNAVAISEAESVERMAGNGSCEMGAGWIEWGGRLPKTRCLVECKLIALRKRSDSSGEISSMETSAKIMEKNELDLMQKENQ
jgi:hypothetical protein